MSVGLTVVVPASSPPVTLAAAKAHVRVDSDDEDDLLTGMIAAAAGYAERFMGRALVDTTYDLVLDTFPANGRPVMVPRPPLIEVLGIYVLDTDDAERELTGYRVDTAQAPGRIFPPAANWPIGTRPGGIRIRYRAGYLRMDGSPPVAQGQVPPDIHAALLLYVGTLYLQRETINIGSNVAEVPWSAEQLLRNHRVELGLA